MKDGGAMSSGGKAWRSESKAEGVTGEREGGGGCPELGCGEKKGGGGWDETAEGHRARPNGKRREGLGGRRGVCVLSKGGFLGGEPG